MMLNLKVEYAELIPLPNFFDNPELPLEAFPQNTEALPALEAALGQAEARIKEAYRVQIAQMFDQMYNLGKSDRALKEEQLRLLNENTILKEQITQLTITVEEEWHSRAAKLSSKINAFCQKVKLFHNSFIADCQPALRHWDNFENYYKTYDKNRDNYSHWQSKECDGNYFKLGEWEATREMYWLYARDIGGCDIRKYLGPIENLSLTSQQTLNVRIDEEIQKIKAELNDEQQSIVPGNEGQQRNTAPHAVMSELEAIFQAAVKRNNGECSTLRQENNNIKRENAILVQRIIKLKNLDDRLQQLFYKHLCSYFSLNDFKHDNQRAIMDYHNKTKNYQTYLSELDTYMRTKSVMGGSYTQGLKLKDVLTTHSNELIQMVKELEKSF